MAFYCCWVFESQCNAIQATNRVTLSYTINEWQLLLHSKPISDFHGTAYPTIICSAPNSLTESVGSIVLMSIERLWSNLQIQRRPDDEPTYLGSFCLSNLQKSRALYFKAAEPELRYSLGSARPRRCTVDIIISASVDSSLKEVFCGLLRTAFGKLPTIWFFPHCKAKTKAKPGCFVA